MEATTTQTTASMSITGDQKPKSSAITEVIDLTRDDGKSINSTT